jgi:hypothetical protein
MFAMNKDTMMMASIVVAFIAVFLLYREIQKTKLDILKLSEFDDVSAHPPPPPPPAKASAKLVSKKSAPPPPPPPVADETD